MSETRKINNASYSVICTLLSLFEKNLTMEELIEELNNRFPRVKFNNFVASKYINTCKACGIDIHKIEGKYSLVNFPVGEKFSKTDTRLLFELKEYSEDLKKSSVTKNVESFIKKLHLTNYKYSAGLRSSENYRIIRLFEKARNAKCNIRLFYKDGKQEDCSPRELYVADGKIYFRTCNQSKMQEVNPDDISNIKITDHNDYESEKYVDVVYELSGKLAQRYQLRENEQIIKYKKNGKIVIINRYEDKTDLLRRLMRYDSCCKLLKPANYVEDFKKMINGALENYR